MSDTDVGRNDPCPCGSGAKYKHCCLRDKKRQRAKSRTSQQEKAERPKERADGESEDSGEAEASAESDAESFYNTDEGIQQWDAFWEEYENASIDERFELARQQIEDNEHFDNDWVFELMVTRLYSNADDHGRIEEWLELTELVRERHPEAVQPERANLAAKALVLLVKAGRADERHEWVEMLLSDPDTSPEHVDRTLEMLAYHGLSGEFTEELGESFSRVHEQGRTKRTVIGWPEWLLTSFAAEWTEDSITQSRGTDDLRARLEELDAEADIDALPSRERFVDPVVETFFGPFEESDLIDAIRDGSTQPPADEERARLTALLARWLVDHKDWPVTRAFLSISEFFTYWGQPSSRPTDSTRDDPDTQKLQSKLNDEHWLLTDPAELKGALKAAGHRAVLNAPWKSACLLAANVEVIDLFDAHDLAQNSRVLDSIRYHLDQRFTSITDTITHLAPDDPAVSAMLDDLRDRL